jgi:hypothetical protein
MKNILSRSEGGEAMVLYLLVEKPMALWGEGLTTKTTESLTVEVSIIVNAKCAS